MCKSEFTTSGIKCRGMGYALSAVSLLGWMGLRAVLSSKRSIGRAVAGTDSRL